MGAVPVLLVLLISAVPAQSDRSSGAAPQMPVPARNGPAVDPDALPISIDKIQRRLAETPAIVLREAELDEQTGLPTFRVRIDASRLTIAEILGPDYLRGPVPAGAMTHQEFLNMVTPKDVQGYAAFSNKEAATVAITSLALQWALKTALARFHESRDARAREAARREVEEALEALRKARLAAGLPDK